MKIEHGFVRGRGGEDWDEAVVELGVHHVFDEIPKRLGVEFLARNMPLELPSVAVGGEDAIAE